MNQRKKTGQTQYLKECLRDSYFSLLNTKKASNISVSEIVKRSGLSRMSFYRYYATKEDILRHYIDDIFQEFLQELSSLEDKTIQSPAILLFRYFRTNQIRVQILIKQDMFYLFNQPFLSFIQETNIVMESQPDITPEIQKFYYRYTSGGILNLIEGWMKGGMQESDENMASILQQIKLSQSAKYK